MALIYIDSNVMNNLLNRTDWYKNLYDDIVNYKSIKLVYYGGKQREEYEVSSKFIKFLNELGNAGKIYSENSDKILPCVDELTQLPQHDCSSCDDPHIFCACGHSGCKLVVTLDSRLLECQKQIGRSKKFKFCTGLKIISTKKAYLRNRTRILEKL